MIPAKHDPAEALSRPLEPERRGAADDRYVPMAREVGAICAATAERHDREGTFVTEGYEALRRSGYLRLAVPQRLGGLGASMRQVCHAQAELGRHDGSTALAASMHLHVVMGFAYRWRRGFLAVRGLLRQIVEDDLVVASSGASDWLWPSGSATAVEGGFRLSGRKSFVSQSPVADIFYTAAVHHDPERGPVVVVLAVDAVAEGVERIDNWDTLGMRGTGSNDVRFGDVFVPADRVLMRRELGKVDQGIRSQLVHSSPVIAAAYFGIAQGARDEAVRVVSERLRGDGRSLAEDPQRQREVGLMDYRLRTAWWALMGAADMMTGDYRVNDELVLAASLAKRMVVHSAIAVVDLAMETVGGGGYYRTSRIERAYRDVRAGKFHPLNSEATLSFAGRLALGQSLDVI
ncbi:MAG: acyl-CoA dehydrogenase family protein [Candidatus Dormibacteria bacterium]